MAIIRRFPVNLVFFSDFDFGQTKGPKEAPNSRREEQGLLIFYIRRLPVLEP